MAPDSSAKADLAAEKARLKAMRPWYKKKRVILPALVVLVGVIAASSGGGSKDDGKTASKSGDTTATKQADLFPGRPDKKDGDKEANVGESVDLSGYTATVKSGKFQQSVSDFEEKGYMVVDVTLVNRDEAAQSYNYFEWKLITPGGRIIDPTITTQPTLGSDTPLATGDLAKGGTVSGNIYWEVGSEKGDYYVIYDPSDLGSDRGVWKVTI